MSAQTLLDYNKAAQQCREVFISKSKDYGASWRVLRPASVTDQLFIKVKRIRTIQLTGEQKIMEDTKGEFLSMVNYGIMGLIQLERGEADEADLSAEECLALYDDKLAIARSLMQSKNHDYGEAWRDMRLHSLTDLIMTKVLRIKQIEDNDGRTLVSEGIDANYLDIINYSIFALILHNTPQS